VRGSRHCLGHGPTPGVWLSQQHQPAAQALRSDLETAGLLPNAVLGACRDNNRLMVANKHVVNNDKSCLQQVLQAHLLCQEGQGLLLSPVLPVPIRPFPQTLTRPTHPAKIGAATHLLATTADSSTGSLSTSPPTAASASLISPWL
jgi:hypothetical protein